MILFQGSFSVLGFPYINQVDEIFIIITFLASLIRIISLKRVSKISVYVLSLLFLFNLSGILSFFINSSGDFSDVIFQSFLYSKFFLLIFSVMNLKIDDKLVYTFLEILKQIGMLTSPFMIINFIFPIKYAQMIPTAFIDRTRIFGRSGAMGLFEHPSVAGTFYLIVTMIYFCQYLSNREKNSLLLTFYYAFVALLTLKVKIIIGVLAIIFLYLLLSNLKQFFKRLFLFSSPVLIILYLAKDLIIDSFYKYVYLGNIEITNISSARQGLLFGSLNIVRDYFPLGVGFSKFGSWYARINYSEYYFKYGLSNIYGLRIEDSRFATDTFWPAILGETGVIGTMVYISLLIYIFFCMLRKKNYCMEKSNYSITLLGLFVFYEAIFETIGEPIFNSAPQNILIGIFVALGLKDWANT